MSKNTMMASALAAGVAVALSACGGGGGGSYVKSDPPPAGGGGTPVEPSVIATANLVVQQGESVTRPVVLTDGWTSSRVDNAGSVGGGAVDVAVSGLRYSTSGDIRNHDGGVIDGRKFAVELGSMVVDNDGSGSLIRSDGTAIHNTFGRLMLRNANGATITGGAIGISVEHGGSIRNLAGSTISTTGTTPGMCGVGGSCAIYASSITEPGMSQDVQLENAGTIVGNVQLANVANGVTLSAGGTIRGDLYIGVDPRSTLTLDAGAGATQAFSQALIGAMTFAGDTTKTGDGTWVLDTDALASTKSITATAGTFVVPDAAFLGNARLATTDGRFLLDFDRDATLWNMFQGTDNQNGVPPRPGVYVKDGSGELTIHDRSVTQGPHFVLEDGALRIASGGVGVGGAISIENNRQVVLDGELTSYIEITGPGSVVRTGGGNVALGQVNTYTGGTRIDGGALTAGGILPGDVVVNAGGTLGHFALNPHGAPGVAGNVVNNGTVIAADGATTIGGNYSQSSTGTLAVELGGKLQVAGTATIGGGTLEVTGIDLTFIANAHTEVLTAAGGLSGTFDRFAETSNDLVLASTTIHYDGNSVWLDTTGLDVTWAAAGDGIGYTPASMSGAVRVQGAFEQLNDRIATDTLAGVSGDFLHAAGQFQRAPTIEAAQASLRSLSGELHAASAAMTFRAIDAGNQALSDHLDELRDGRAAFGLWTQQLDSGGGMARSGFDGLGFQLDGWLVGNDYRLGRSGVVGFAFGQGQGVQQLQEGADRDTSRRTEGMVYAGTGGDRWYAQGRLGFGQFRQDVSRALLLGDAAEGVSTRYGGRYQVAYAESGLRWNRGVMRIAPFVGMEYARSDRDAFAEEGAGGFGLRSDAQSTSRWQASAGLRAAHQWNFGRGRSLDVGAHAQWFRTLGTTGEAMDASFVGLQQWSPLLGIGLSRHGSLAGVGLDAQLSPTATLKLSYDYERGQYDNAHGMTAGVNVAF